MRLAEQIGTPSSVRPPFARLSLVAREGEVVEAERAAAPRRDLVVEPEVLGAERPAAVVAQAASFGLAPELSRTHARNSSSVNGTRRPWRMILPFLSFFVANLDTIDEKIPLVLTWNAFGSGISSLTLTLGLIRA